MLLRTLFSSLGYLQRWRLHNLSGKPYMCFSLWPLPLILPPLLSRGVCLHLLCVLVSTEQRRRTTLPWLVGCALASQGYWYSRTYTSAWELLLLLEAQKGRIKAIVSFWLWRVLLCFICGFFWRSQQLLLLGLHWHLQLLTATEEAGAQTLANLSFVPLKIFFKKTSSVVHHDVQTWGILCCCISQNSSVKQKKTHKKQKTKKPTVIHKVNFRLIFFFILSKSF